MQANLENPLSVLPAKPLVETDCNVHACLDVYLEATDAGGKDSTAHAIERQRRAFGEKTTQSAGFFSPEATERFERWRAQYPDVEPSGLLLAATVFDLANIDDAPSEAMRVQVSHNSVRGAAYQQAFDLPYSELFARTTSILPRNYMPIALTATIPELQRRVKENPVSTRFDFLVCEQPDRIDALMGFIRDRCILLGGKAIDTTLLTPMEIAEKINSDIRPTTRPDRHDPPIIHETAYDILSDLHSMDKTCTPLINEFERVLHEKHA